MMLCRGLSVNEAATTKFEISYRSAAKWTKPYCEPNADDLGSRSSNVTLAELKMMTSSPNGLYPTLHGTKRLELHEEQPPAAARAGRFAA
jgi:hypothetical protein